MLNRIISAEGLDIPLIKIHEIRDTCNKDLRNAIQTLQLVSARRSLNKNETSLRKEQLEKL